MLGFLLGIGVVLTIVGLATWEPILTVAGLVIIGAVMLMEGSHERD